jgi:hypothetical protein
VTKEFQRQKEQVDLEKIRNKRKDRIDDSLTEIFFGYKIHNSLMVEVFTKACEYSDEFKIALEDFNKEPKDPNPIIYKQRKEHLAKYCWIKS